MRRRRVMTTRERRQITVVQEATKLMALCQTESASARRYAASLGTYGIEEATLKRLSAFAEMSEKACASLHRLLANDAKPEEKELEAITQGLSEEKLWFTGVRGGYEQMSSSAPSPHTS